MSEVILLITVLLIVLIIVLFELFIFRQNSILKNESVILDRKIDSLEKIISSKDNGLSSSLEAFQRAMSSQMQTNAENIHAMNMSMNDRLDKQTASVERSIDTLRNSYSSEMKQLREENAGQLQEIKGVVNEQLHDALDKKLKQSFDSVVEQLSNVQRGLGEMQSLAGDVGDLKKTLSNVKTRGIFGEIQLGAILEQILSPEQYATNVVTVRGSRDPVEFAVKLPGNGEDPVYLPIDSKFPGDTYNQLVDAYEAGNASAVAEAQKKLETRIMAEAKDISEKYIHVPETTEFGIMFLPSEGLYAEVLRLNLVEKLQSKYKVSVAGPTTITALLNSLQMGFRTLAIQKRSDEVWKVLGTVKSEFGKYQEAVENVQKRLNQANDDFEKLVGVRTRAINRSLLQISSTSETADENDMLIDR